MYRKPTKRQQEARARKLDAMRRGKWVTAIAYEIGNVEKYKAFGCVITKGSPPSGVKSHEWLVAKVREHGVGLQDAGDLEFLNLSASSIKV